MEKDDLKFDKIWEGFGIIYRIVVNVQNIQREVTFYIRIPYINPINRQIRQNMFNNEMYIGYTFDNNIEYKNTYNSVIKNTRIETLKSIKKIYFDENNREKSKKDPTTGKILDTLIFGKVNKDDKINVKL